MATTGVPAVRYSRRKVLAALGALSTMVVTGCGDDDSSAVEMPSPSPVDTSTPPPVAATSPTASAAPPSAQRTTTRQPANTRAYVPPPEGEWEKADLAKTGWSPAGIADVVALVGANRSATFMMLSGGRIVTEYYFGGVTAATVNDVASVQKSVTSTLLGIAQEKDLLNLDDPVSGYLAPGWSRARPADEARITIRHLMTHSSGLNPRTLVKVADPGTEFNYNTPAYQKTRPVLESAAGMDINTVTRQWLFDAIAVSDEARWAPRPSGEVDATGAAQWGLFLAARDMARFGLLSLSLGLWDDVRLIKRTWYDDAWAASDVAPDYGLLWWLMGKKPKFAQAPDDWVAALGAKDQKIYVVPSLDLVVTRQGLAANEESEHESDFDRVLVQAIAAARV
ncbi:MAG: serine hydrolase domain-containing protein [Dehalococcoidia bacterium]